MARERDPNRDKAYQLWKRHNGEITNREIANKLDIDEKKVAVWKSRDKWDSATTSDNVVQRNKVKKNNVVQQKQSVVEIQQKKDNKRERKRSGNPNPKNQFTKRNTAAVKHGLHAKYIPDDMQEIIDSMNSMSAEDIIWQNIEIQYASIIRAQQIMWVQDADSLLSEEVSSSYGQNGTSQSFKVAFAYEQYDSFLKSQSRAMGELRSLIKQFVAMADESDERKQKLQMMDMQMNKLKAETELTQEKVKLIKGQKKDTSLLEALINTVKE